MTLPACGGPSPAPMTAEPRTTSVADTRAGDVAPTSCEGLPNADDLKRLLQEAPSKNPAGGLMDGRMEWASVVNRAGQVCATAVATDDPSAAWPGSQAIAKAKAFTANAFSTDQAPLSTARLYTLTQPGQSLWGIAAANGFNPDCLVGPGEAASTDGKMCGGTIAFGGGVPLYRDGRRIGGLGVSGDTACADHEVAKTMRGLAGLNPAKGPSADDIHYAELDGPSVFAHPLCPNTMRDGKKVGDAQPGAQSAR